MLNLPSVFGVIVAYRFRIDIRCCMYGLLYCIYLFCLYSVTLAMYNLSFSCSILLKSTIAFP